MTNKNLILSLLKEKTLSLNKKKEIGISTIDISTELNIKRNVVSHYLNQLVKEGFAFKINTRPVYFLYKDYYENNKQDFIKTNEYLNTNSDPSNTNVFSNLIGYNGSLKNVIQQCKAAVNYPPNGLPILLTGESGVGKSYIATLIHKYAINKEIISKKSNLIIFNCAEYSNNPELLTSILFGCTKGAYTGADTDKKGLIEQSDGGYLFLDEVHRLPPEGQEKLFLFMDKGIFKRLGEVDNWRKANVRLIFATTESLNKYFLTTFLRRIPLKVKIPNFDERPLREKLSLIHSFYYNEKSILGVDLSINSDIIELLSSIKLNGNIGKLQNAIKFSCASAYTDSVESENATSVNVNLSNMPIDIIKDYTLPKHNKNSNKFVHISSSYNTILSNYSDIRYVENLKKDLIKTISFYKDNKITKDVFITKSNKIIHTFNEIHLSNMSNYALNTKFKYLEKLIDLQLDYFKAQFGLHYYNTVTQNVALIILLSDEYIFKNKEASKDSFEFISNIYPKESYMINLISENIKDKLYINIDDTFKIYLILYFSMLNNRKSNYINALIVTHGYSTATSLAATTNNILNEYIYDSIDMPLDISSKEISQRIKDYIKTINVKKGLIILVDMGSLQDIYLEIKKTFNGDLAIINNVSLILTINIGLEIYKNESIDNIMQKCVKKNVTSYNYIPLSSKKKNGIITTCITGIGTANKIRNLLNECLEGQDIEVFSYDYNELLSKGKTAPIFDEYDIQLIIGISNPNVENIPFISLEELILEDCNVKLNNVLKNIIDTKIVQNINDIILKEFTLENVINHLVILNPDKLLDHVQIAFKNLSSKLNLSFSNSLKLSLYIHSCCMIERLVVKESSPKYKNLDKTLQCNRHYINSIKKSFSVIENFYNITIPDSELAFILDILNTKITLS